MPQPGLIIALVASIALSTMGCGKEETGAEGPAPEVVVAPVEQKDVEIFTEWVGTTTGFVNAQIYPKIQGYLLKQVYKDGGVVAAGDLLFEIDPRQYKAALDQAQGQLGRSQAALSRSELDVKRYTPLAATGAVSQKELDDAIQMRAANRADVDSAAHRTNKRASYVREGMLRRVSRGPRGSSKAMRPPIRGWLSKLDRTTDF